ncbi:MAG TPA: hypothetical protein VGM90_37150 [Kofleriaceae bacterium]|jgi:hypothetical protein
MRAPLILVALAACGNAATAGGDDANGNDPARTCLSPEADRTGTQTLTDALGTATVEAADATPCLRHYTLSSTAPRRDNSPPNGEGVDEVDGWPTLRTGNDMFDAMYALALSETRQASVSYIHDAAFSNNEERACGADTGCFETGKSWTYVWTRDTSYAADLGLAALDPDRARGSLEFKLSTMRGGDTEEIVQDTGTGGSYPVSTDRVVWALGADAVLAQMPEGAARDAFMARAYAAISATLDRDREVVFDTSDGLYRGEQSFLDWREQTYPAFVATDVTPIASSKALSTNILHLRALQVAATLGDKLGKSNTYAAWATQLQSAIRGAFWIEDAGMFATFVASPLDSAPARQFDLLGNSLAVLSGVATDAQATKVLAHYPHMGPGAAPVIFPEQQLTRVYHNRAEWPFVTAYWLRAAAQGKNAAVAARAVKSLMRAAALNMSNMENLEIASGAPWVDDGAYSGPVVDSQRQLWSIGGYLSMVQHTLFGVHATSDGLAIEPFVPRELRASLFATTDSLILNDLPWRGTKTSVVLHLPASESAATGAYVVKSMKLNGAAVTGMITRAQLDDSNRIDVELGDPDDATEGVIETRDVAQWHQVFAPRVPTVGNVARSGTQLVLPLAAGGDDLATVTYSIYRDGTRIANAVPGATTSWTDTTANVAAAACYAVETCFTDSGNCSQRSKASCWWDDNYARITSYDASTLTAIGGTASTDHGRFHYDAWGDAGNSLSTPTISATRTGPYLIQAVYGNGAGGVDTGVACGLKRVDVIDTANNATVATGFLVMPQTGSWDTWAESTFVTANLEAGKTYRVVVAQDGTSRNMSALSSFATYGGTGGAGGEFSRVNISELKLLAR